MTLHRARVKAVLDVTVYISEKTDQINSFYKTHVSGKELAQILRASGELSKLHEKIKHLDLTECSYYKVAHTRGKLQVLSLIVSGCHVRVYFLLTVFIKSLKTLKEFTKIYVIEQGLWKFECKNCHCRDKRNAPY